MNEKDKQDLAALRALAQENSDRNKAIDYNEGATAAVAFIWLGTAALFLLLIFITNWNVPWWSGIVVPTFLTFAIVRWNRYLEGKGY